MRVTHSMMINNMSYWAQQQAQKLDEAQTVVGSGKKINKPSDDPVAVSEIMSDSANISQYGQYESNIAQAQTWVKASSATLDAVSTSLQDASNTVSSYLSGGMNSATAVGTLTKYYDAILSLANSQYGSTYMYSGNLSNTLPFANNVDIVGSVPADIIFDLAATATNVAIQISDSSGTVVRNITVGAGGVAGTNTVTWDGNDNAANPLPDGEYSYTITASGVTGAVAAYPSYRGDAGGKEVLTGINERVVLNNNGGNIFSSILSSVSQAITAINNNNTSAVSTIATLLQQNRADLLARQVELSNAGIQLDSSNSRLQQLTTNTTNRIADLEVGSTEEAAIRLQAQKTTYQEVISVTADVLKMPKLADYL